MSDAEFDYILVCLRMTSTCAAGLVQPAPASVQWGKGFPHRTSVKQIRPWGRQGTACVKDFLRDLRCQRDRRWQLIVLLPAMQGVPRTEES